MEALFFILKMVIINALLVGIIGFFVGVFLKWKNGTLHHEIFPRWVFWAGFGGVIGGIAGLVLSVLLYVSGYADSVDTTICATGLGLMFLLGFATKSR